VPVSLIGSPSFSIPDNEVIRGVFRVLRIFGMFGMYGVLGEWGDYGF